MRRSERLRRKNMDDKNKENSECRTINVPDELEHSEHDASEDEETVVEQSSVDELKEEIRSLKDSYRMLLERTGLSSPTKIALPRHPIEMPNLVTPPPTTATYNAIVPPNNNKMPASRQPMQQQISIDKTSISNSFIPNVSLPYYSQTYMPPHIAQPYMSTSSEQNNNSLTTPSLQTYMPLPYIQNFMPPQSTQAFTSTSTRQTPATTSTFTSAATATPFHNTQLFNEYRPIRKLHDLPEFNGQPEQWPMFAVSYRETTQNYNYTNLENLTRLQKSLKGDAKAKVEAYLIHPENVNQVMSTLEFHYGRPQIMIRSQISKVRAFPLFSWKTLVRRLICVIQPSWMN